MSWNGPTGDGFIGAISPPPSASQQCFEETVESSETPSHVHSAFPGTVRLWNLEFGHGARRHCIHIFPNYSCSLTFYGMKRPLSGVALATIHEYNDDSRSMYVYIYALLTIPW